MKPEKVWRVECIECSKTFRYKDNNNNEIKKPEVVKNINTTSGVCQQCLEIALRPLIGLA